jgi:hypothetical protein
MKNSGQKNSGQTPHFHFSPEPSAVSEQPSAVSALPSAAEIADLSLSLAPALQNAFRALAASLRTQIQPSGQLEEDLFLAHAWHLFEAQRMRALESRALANFEADPENDKLLRRLDRLTALVQRYERGAIRLRKEIGKLQADRLSANEPNQVIAWAGHKDKPLPATLPAEALRRTNKWNAIVLANNAMFGFAAGNGNYSPFTEEQREEFRRALASGRFSVSPPHPHGG